VGWADSWTSAGLRPGKSLFTIFSSFLLFLFVLFMVSIHPFEFNFILQDFGFGYL
jgi:hypothetical protein